MTGIVFLGTPSRGPDIPYWSDLLTKLANVAISGKSRQDLLNNLELKSTEMGNICSHFVELGPALQIISLYETLPMPVINAFVSEKNLKIDGLPYYRILMNVVKIVDEMSAKLRLTNETAIPLEANHQTMCSFLTNSNPSYLLVRECFADIIDALARIPDFQCTFLQSSPSILEINGMSLTH